MKKINFVIILFLALINNSALAMCNSCAPSYNPACLWSNLFVGIEGGASISRTVYLAPDWSYTGRTQITWVVPPGSSFDTDLGTAPMEGAKLGFRVNPNVAIDVAYNHRGNFSSDRTFPITRRLSVGEEFIFSGIKTDSYLVDLTLNPTVCWCGFTPYVSGGIGLSRNTIGGLEDRELFTSTLRQNSDIDVPGKTVTSFAWQVGVGVDYLVCKKLHFNLGYRFVDIGKLETEGNFIDRISSPNVSQTIQPFVATHVGFNEVYAGLTYSFA